MKLSKFSLSAGDNSVIHNDHYYNLSKGYVFVGLDYDVINQEISFKWMKGFGGGQDGQPDELLFEFSGVDFYKARERDITKPYPRDEVVTSMGFASNDEIAGFGGSYQDAPDDTHQHLCFEFASGFAIKFAAETASLKTKYN
jgi:hypothetical protein